jgi:hypothetical protein
MPWHAGVRPHDLVRGDLGGDIHNENPAEELNRFPEVRPAARARACFTTMCVKPLSD